MALPAALALVWLSASAAQAARPSSGGAANRILSLELFELALFDRRTKMIEARMSRLRQKKIESLDRILKSNQPYGDRVSQLFRLGEALWEEATYRFLLALEAHATYRHCLTQSQTGCQPAPAARPNRGKALRYFRRVRQKYPTYRRIDEVEYYLGRSALRAASHKKTAALRKKAVAHFERIVRDHPKSRFRADAHLLLGEAHFGRQPAIARDHYQEVLTQHGRSLLRPYALYKLAWSWLQLKQYAKARDAFRKTSQAIAQFRTIGYLLFQQEAQAGYAEACRRGSLVCR